MFNWNESVVVLHLLDGPMIVPLVSSTDKEIGAPLAAVFSKPFTSILRLGNTCPTMGITPTTPRIEFTVPWIGLTMLFNGVRTISVTTDRGRLTPEHALTNDVGKAACAEVAPRDDITAADSRQTLPRNNALRRLIPEIPGEASKFKSYP